MYPTPIQNFQLIFMVNTRLLSVDSFEYLSYSEENPSYTHAFFINVKFFTFFSTFFSTYTYEIFCFPIFFCPIFESKSACIADANKEQNRHNYAPDSKRLKIFRMKFFLRNYFLFTY